MTRERRSSPTRLAGLASINAKETALKAKLRAPEPQKMSTPFEPSWPNPNPLLGATVLYVMPDGSDRPALVLSLHDDDRLTLNVRVAFSPDDRIQTQQYPAVPHGAAGEPETWREVSDDTG